MTDDELIAMLENVVDYQGASTECELAAARLRALIAERDAFQAAAQQQMARAEALEDYVERNDYIGGWRTRAEKAEAEVARLRGLLREARDAMWKGRGTPALMVRIDAEFATEAAP
jgi:type I site-specific restriction endonuclease